MEPNDNGYETNMVVERGDSSVKIEVDYDALEVMVEAYERRLNFLMYKERQMRPAHFNKYPKRGLNYYETKREIVRTRDAIDRLTSGTI